MTTVQNIPMSDIHADDDFNCRGKIAPIDVVDLAKDIAENGLIQPVTVCLYSEERQKETGKKYLLIAGYRRYTAHRINEAETIQAIIKEIDNEAQARLINLSENLKRQDLNILQEAKALERLEGLGLTEEEAGKRLGMSRGWIQVRFMVLRLPEVVQQEIAAGFLNQTQIRDVYSHLRAGGPEKCIEATRHIKEARQRGEQHVRLPNKKPLSQQKHSKKQRKRPEIFEMMEHIQETLGNGIHTRCLAWCAGEITTGDLYRSLKQWADESGKDYQIPS